MAIAAVIVVMPIVGFVGYVAASNIFGQGIGARKQTTLQSMTTIRSALLQYNLDHGSYPPSLNALVPKYLAASPVDTWKRPFVYSPTPSGTNPFILSSTGASGQDVIDYWKEKELLNK